MELIQCYQLHSSQERNVVEAAARGAIESIAVIASIMVNLIAFIAMMAFLDAILGYLGSLVGYEELGFQVGVMDLMAASLHSKASHDAVILCEMTSYHILSTQNISEARDSCRVTNWSQLPIRPPNLKRYGHFTPNFNPRSNGKCYNELY